MESLFFATNRGVSPVKTFINSLDSQTIAKVIKTIELLQTHGPALPLPYSKKLTKEIKELRILGQQSIRILYVNHQSEYYLLHAFKKKTQKTPAKEIKVALDRKTKII